MRFVRFVRTPILCIGVYDRCVYVYVYVYVYVVVVVVVCVCVYVYVYTSVLTHLRRNLCPSPSPSPYRWDLPGLCGFKFTFGAFLPTTPVIGATGGTLWEWYFRTVSW